MCNLRIVHPPPSTPLLLLPKVEVAAADGPSQRAWCLAALSTQVALGAHFAAAHARAHSCFGSHGRGSAANGSPSKSGAGPGAATAEAEAAGAPRAAAAVLGPKLRPKVVTLLELTLVAAARGGTADRSVISHSLSLSFSISYN